MATLLNAVTSNTTGTGSAMTGPCTVYVRGTLAGAEVVIQVADENVSASYVPPDKSIISEHRFSGPGAVTLNAVGAYFVRALLGNASDSTSVTVVALQ